jgi:hypothetical protein
MHDRENAYDTQSMLRHMLTWPSDVLRPLSPPFPPLVWPATQGVAAQPATHEATDGAAELPPSKRARQLAPSTTLQAQVRQVSMT